MFGELASRQHGVVSRQQLLDLGVDSGAIGRRVRAGRLHPVHQGVHSVGHTSVSREGHWMAAVLRGGPGAVLSHRSGAVLWNLCREEPTIVDITVVHESRSGPGLQRHRAKLPPDEVTRRRGIPVTTPSRTLLDLSSVLCPADLLRAIREAEVLRLPLRPTLDELIQRHRGRRGVGALGRCLRALGRQPSGLTRSHLEDRFVSAMAAARLPAPETNAVIELGTSRVEVDCLWREQGLVVELDGHEAHGTRAAFEADRKRDRRLHAAGWTVVRVTWRQLRDEPDAVAADLRTLLA